GYITGVAPFGLFVELVDHYVEGLAHISTLSDDYYRFTEGAHTLVGERSGRIYRLGDHVRVRIARIDLERRMIDLAVEQVLDEPREAPLGRKARAARPRRAAGARTAMKRPRPRAPRPGKKERAFRKKR